MAGHCSDRGRTADHHVARASHRRGRAAPRRAALRGRVSTPASASQKVESTCGRNAPLAMNDYSAPDLARLRIDRDVLARPRRRRRWAWLVLTIIALVAAGWWLL